MVLEPATLLLVGLAGERAAAITILLAAALLLLAAVVAAVSHPATEAAASPAATTIKGMGTIPAIRTRTTPARARADMDRKESRND